MEGSVKIITVRIRIQDVQKHNDPPDPDPDPGLEHWLHHVQGAMVQNI